MAKYNKLFMCHIHRSESTSIFGTNNVICREIWLHLWFLPYQFSIFDDVGSWQPCYWASDYLPSQKIYSPHTNGVDFFQALRTMTLCRYLHVLDKWWIQIWGNYTKVSGKNFLINLIVYTNTHYYSTMILYLPVHLLSNFH